MIRTNTAKVMLFCTRCSLLHVFSSKFVRCLNNIYVPSSLYIRMNATRHISHAWIVGVVALVIFSMLPLRHFAQERKVQNRPYIDMRRWHYGFLFGLHMQDLEFINNGYVHTLEDGTEEAWFTDVATYNPGFSVGVLGEWYLTQHLALRVIPTMHFGDKMVRFREQKSGKEEKQNIKSTYLSVPINVKYAAQRFNNYRPYVVAGLSPMIDLTVKKQKALLTKRFDLALELGMGCDFYLPFFKFIPEIKFCFGLTDLLVKDRSDLIDKNLLKYTESLEGASSRMVVLTFYFE